MQTSDLSGKSDPVNQSAVARYFVQITSNGTWLSLSG